jgi:polyvinyl alcohol dehydrogenase (cytochrome)
LEDAARHPTGAVLTASPAVLGDFIHIGVSRVPQEVAVRNDNVPCCSFRGSEVAVNARTGAILWKTFMAPSGYTGTAATRSSTPGGSLLIRSPRPAAGAHPADGLSVVFPPLRRSLAVHRCRRE